MEPTNEQLNNRRIWIEALESDKLPQGQGSLGDANVGFCCLGLGCYVLGVKYDPSDSFPPKAFCDKVGLPYDEELLGTDLDAQYVGGNLVNDNDARLLSFPYIAQIIKTTPSLWKESDFQQARLAEEQAAIDEANSSFDENR